MPRPEDDPEEEQKKIVALKDKIREKIDDEKIADEAELMQKLLKLLKESSKGGRKKTRKRRRKRR